MYMTMIETAWRNGSARSSYYNGLSLVIGSDRLRLRVRVPWWSLLFDVLDRSIPKQLPPFNIFEVLIMYIF